MNKEKKSNLMIIFIFLACCAAVGFILPFSALADKKVVRILWLADMTGPYSATHNQIQLGVEDFVTWANQTEYIKDVKLVVDTYDHGMDMSKVIAAFNLGMGKKPRPLMCNGGMSTPTALAVKPLAKREKIPCIDGTSARPLLVPPDWYFSISPCYEGQVGAAANWIMSNWKHNSKVEFIKKRYQKRAPRLAIIGWDNAFGRSFDQKEVRAYLKKIGIDYIGAEYIPMHPTDTTPQLLRLKKKGVDFAFMVMYANAHAVVLKDAAKLGMHKDFMTIGFQLDSIYDLHKYVGSLADSIMAVQLTHVGDLNGLPSGLQALYLKRSKVDLQSYCTSVAYLDLMSEVIRKAIDRVGLDKLNGKECYYSITHEIKNFKNMALTNPMRFSTSKPYGTDYSTMFHWKDGKVAILDNKVRIPNLLPGGSDVPK